MFTAQRILPLLMASTLFALGCNGDPAAELADDLGVEQDATEEGKADGLFPRPLGTYLPVGPGPFASLTLNADKTYTAGVVVYCIQAPCYPYQQDGTYKFVFSGLTQYIKLTTNDGVAAGKYAYLVAGDSLAMRAAGTAEWFFLEKQPEVPAVCGGPNETRPNGGCPAGYHCTCPNGAYCYIAGECVAGETCGDVVCAAGTVCCNPLMSLCTLPGEMCAF